jgi:hypothetical protein
MPRFSQRSVGKINGPGTEIACCGNFSFVERRNAAVGKMRMGSRSDHGQRNFCIHQRIGESGSCFFIDFTVIVDLITKVNIAGKTGCDFISDKLDRFYSGKILGAPFITHISGNESAFSGVEGPATNTMQRFLLCHDVITPYRIKMSYLPYFQDSLSR